MYVQNISRWEFRSEGHDIKFGIVCQDMNETETAVVPMHKVNSHLSDEIGVITCPTPATCKYAPLKDHTHCRNNAGRTLYLDKCMESKQFHT